jgi:hypothetical protein
VAAAMKIVAAEDMAAEAEVAVRFYFQLLIYLLAVLSALFYGLDLWIELYVRRL